MDSGSALEELKEKNDECPADDEDNQGPAYHVEHAAVEDVAVERQRGQFGGAE